MVNFTVKTKNGELSVIIRHSYLLVNVPLNCLIIYSSSTINIDARNTYFHTHYCHYTFFNFIYQYAMPKKDTSVMPYSLIQIYIYIYNIIPPLAKIRDIANGYYFQLRNIVV